MASGVGATTPIVGVLLLIDVVVASATSTATTASPTTPVGEATLQVVESTTMGEATTATHAPCARCVLKPATPQSGAGTGLITT